MRFHITSGSLAIFQGDGIILGLFEGDKKIDNTIAVIDKNLGGTIKKMIVSGEIKGKLNEVTILHACGKLPINKIAVVGLGTPNKFTVDRIRQTIAESCRALRKSGAKRIATGLIGLEIKTIKPDTIAQMIAEGALLGLYGFKKYQTKQEEQSQIEDFTIITSDKKIIPMIEQGIKQGEIIAKAVNVTRDLVNEPAGVMTPTELANRTKRLAQQVGLEIKIIGQPEMKNLGMGALLGVAQGSQQPPRFIILRYWGAGKKSIIPPLGIIGKGVTFDSGGISIKPSSDMDEMKSDMAGAAAVIGTMVAIAQLKPKINITALAPATENLPSGTAFKPGDILKAMNGKTIEILSTDAEGRLILADAICYAKQMGLSPIIDVATLTSACIVALGAYCTGAFTNNQALLNKLKVTSQQAGEYIWQLPMFEEYGEMDKSNIADIKNLGGKGAGAITAAKFLEFFVEDTPWVHFDIAPTAYVSKGETEKHYRLRGATGVMVRTLVNYIMAENNRTEK
ncbi:MAG: leucyl aminopeptidase [bacterium]